MRVTASVSGFLFGPPKGASKVARFTPELPEPELLLSYCSLFRSSPQDGSTFETVQAKMPVNPRVAVGTIMGRIHLGRLDKDESLRVKKKHGQLMILAVYKNGESDLV